MAATATYDFDTDPTANLTINGNNDAVWVPTGGNPATGGFLAITYSQNGQNAAVIFPDIDEGKLVKAFRFEADLRVGNSTGDRGADGFSVSFARSNDPYLANPANVGGGFAGGGPAEFGTQTGIAVSFDTWSGNALPDGPDIEGIIVRVDNVTVNRTGLPTRHGSCEDDTSLQTGPRDAAYWTEGLADPRDPGSWATLCWQPFVIDLDETGKLTVQWKGRTILDQFQTTYFPSVSQLVLAGRTGDANEHTHFDNVVLTTVQADNPIVGLPEGDACGFEIPIADAGTITPNESTIVTTLNGAAITPGISREGANTILTFSPATRLAPGSTNTIVVNFNTSEGEAISQTRTYIVPAATIFTAADATTQFTASSSGFTVRVHQLETGRGPGDGNNIPNMENQLAGGFLNADGTPRENLAFASGTPSGNYDVPLINFEQNAGSAGNFTGLSDPVRQDDFIPGIPGALGGTDNVAAEILTFLELSEGCHTFGVRSDDGFVANLGHSPFGPVLGFFGTGRGADNDSVFRIVVEQAGVYPVRLAWSEGGGGASIEFFSILPDGTKILVNDRENPNAIKAYSVGRGPGILQSIAPANGWGGANPTGPVVITFKDDLTTLNEGSVVVTIDGATVTPTKADSGALTTYTFAPSSPWAFGSSHSGSVTYAFGSGAPVTQNFTFAVRGLAITDLPNGFAIEAEHFDYDAGQHVTSVDTQPYEGGEYFGLGAVRDTDYRAPDNGPFNATTGAPDGYNYRTGIPAEPAPSENRFVPMDSQLDPGTLDVQRPGGWEVTTNYKIGWTGDEWYNYTRVIPAGNYKVVGVQSHGNAAGEANRLRARFGVVVEGAGTANQTVVPIGSYSQPATGGWGVNAISAVQQNGADTVVNLSGTQTLRVWVDEGDFDWFALIPTTEQTPPPSVTSVSPANGSFSLATALSLDITDVLRSLKINLSSVRLTVNGTDVTSSAQITDTTGGVNVRYQPAAGFEGGTTYNYTLAFNDSGGTARSFEGSFTSAYSAQAFVIEAEDFNHGSGQTVAAASTMPLQAGLYNGLGAVHDIDYHVNQNQADSNLYRTGEDPNVPMDLNNGDLNRGPFSVTQSYKIGWIDNGEWFNYTRTFPANEYLVFASISHGGTAATDFTGGALDLVTGGINESNQTVQALGTFRADGPTGGWGVNRLVPLRDSGGNIVSVSLSGAQTVRYTAHNGDFNYLLFIPGEGGGGGDEAQITAVTRSGNNLTITWTGGGNLYQANSLNADGSATWSAVPGAGSGTATVPIEGNTRFFMVRP
jgi:hypothetical protein